MTATDVAPGEIFARSARIEERVGQLGRELAQQLADAGGRAPPLLVSPLCGGVVFAADLSRALPYPHALELVDPVSYAKGRRQGVRRITQSFSPRLDVTGRDVVLVDGIVDTGLTLKFVLDEVTAREPNSVLICVLFDRPPARMVELPIALAGFTAPDALLVGYGLDHDGRHAQLPDVHLLGAVGATRLEQAA